MAEYFLATKNDCERVIESLISIIEESFPKLKFSFMVYGSYLREWRIGLSDLDGIIYFHESPFSEIVNSSSFKKLRLLMSALYSDMPFLKNTGFLSDVRILDQLHGRDGRFMIHDATSFKMFLTPGNYAIVHGEDFIPKLNPMSLFNFDEFDLASAMQCLRKYLFFELPKKGEYISIIERKNAFKFFRTLPRITSKLLGEPIDSIPEAINLLCHYFPNIDYEVLREMDYFAQHFWELEELLNSWHYGDRGFGMFILGWLCHEQTLEALVNSMPAKGQH
jgi:hypothetical protein